MLMGRLLILMGIGLLLLMGFELGFADPDAVGRVYYTEDKYALRF